MHATHRLTLLRFFLIIGAAGLAAYATAAFNNQYLLSAVVAFSVFVVTFLFSKLEQRVRYLVKISEAAMSRLEDRIAANIEIREIRLVEEADKKEVGSWSYRVAFQRLFNLAYILSVIGILASVYLGQFADSQDQIGTPPTTHENLIK